MRRVSDWEVVNSGGWLETCSTKTKLGAMARFTERRSAVADVAEMKINRLAPWFGADTAVCGRVAELLRGQTHVTIPFGGGMAAAAVIQARSGVINDLHRHVINLARVVRDDGRRTDLIARLRGMLFHPDELFSAQRYCKQIEEAQELRYTLSSGGPSLFGAPPPVDAAIVDEVQWAAAYFVCSWMGRGGHAGKASEFTQGLAVRFTATGGDSAVRFQSAVDSLEAWGAALRRWQFMCEDALELLTRVRDEPDYGVYVDAPWPDAGNEYRHRCNERQQRFLAQILGRFTCANVIVRFGLHPLIRELYPESRWRWELMTSRDQVNGAVCEALLVRR